MKTTDWLKYGFLAGAIYLVYKAVKGTAAIVVNAQQAAGSTVADAAQFLLGNGIAQPGNTYEVTMPDGSVQTLAYGMLPNNPGVTGAAAAFQQTSLPPATTGTQIGTGNAIEDALSQGASGGG
jgi:hypothetical protein